MTFGETPATGRRLRIGVVGCGEVTQIMHLPAFAQLPDRFEVTALCDISADVLARVAGPIAPVATYRRYEDLCADANVDAVLVANPHIYHVPVALAALAGHKHVFIEKPMAMTLADADALERAQQTAGTTVQIGYMRRYAGAFAEAAELLAGLDEEMSYARVQDFIGANRLIIDDTSHVWRAVDLTEAEAAAPRELAERKIGEAIGTDDPALLRSYSLLLGLSTHDLSAMRELLGMPKGVLHAAQKSGGNYMSACFDYGGFVCDFATGLDRIPRFDAFIEVRTQSRIIRVDYDTPYVRNQPARLTVTERRGTAGVSETVSFPSRLDTFVIEWRAFHDSVNRGASPKTSIHDARQDLELIAAIMAQLKKRDFAERCGEGTPV